MRRNTAILILSLSVLAALFAANSGILKSPRDSNSREAQSGEANPENAYSASAFVNSIGVNTHLNYFDRTYGNFALVEKELTSIGIRHVRDGIHLQNSDYNNSLYGRWVQLGSHGVRFDSVLDPRNKLGPITPALLEQIEQLSGNTIEAFEGPNELDVSGLKDWVTADRDFESSIFSAAKSFPWSTRPQVIAPSLAFVSHGQAFGATLEDFDVGNLHPYPAGKMPSVIFTEQTDLAKRVFGDRPIVFTESGYHNAVNDHSDQPAVSEQAAAKYIPRLFLENFAHGIIRTYLYELFDEAPDPEVHDNQMHWGLIRADGSEKPACVALKRLIEELSDSSGPSSPMSLTWSIDSIDPALHHLLLKKSDGTFDLILWQEVPSYDLKVQRDTSNVPIKTTLSLANEAKQVALFEPVLQTGPIGSYANTRSVSLEVPDHPLVVEIRLEQEQEPLVKTGNARP
jgi:hypothetical protein